MSKIELTFENFVIRKDGSTIPIKNLSFEEHKEAVTNAQDRIMGFFGYERDDRATV